MIYRRTLTVLALSALASGCIGGRYGVDPASIQRPAAEPLSEAQVVAIAAAADSALIRQGRVAERLGRSNGVRELGQQIAEDAAAMNQRLLSAASTAGIPAAAHRVPDQLARAGAPALAGLEEAPQATFDRAFLRQQIALSHWYVAMLDNALLPSSRTLALRNHLAAVRARTASYLEAARAIGNS